MRRRCCCGGGGCWCGLLPLVRVLVMLGAGAAATTAAADRTLATIALSDESGTLSFYHKDRHLFAKLAQHGIRRAHGVFVTNNDIALMPNIAGNFKQNTSPAYINHIDVDQLVEELRKQLHDNHYMLSLPFAYEESSSMQYYVFPSKWGKEDTLLCKFKRERSEFQLWRGRDLFLYARNAKKEHDNNTLGVISVENGNSHEYPVKMGNIELADNVKIADLWIALSACGYSLSREIYNPSTKRNQFYVLPKSKTLFKTKMNCGVQS